MSSASNDTTPGSAVPDFRQPQGRPPTLSETAPPHAQPSSSSSSGTATAATAATIPSHRAATTRQLLDFANVLKGSVEDLNQRSERWEGILDETREGMRLKFASMERQTELLFSQTLQETRGRVRAVVEEEKQRRRSRRRCCLQPEQIPEEARMNELLRKFQTFDSHTIVTPEQFRQKVDAVKDARSADLASFDRVRDDISSDFRAAFDRN